tara:strand:+ start:83 stop:721 length:639 start_codon:yes stop_codon:yes gene_type:complete
MKKVGIIDINIGSLNSLSNCIESMKIICEFCKNPDQIFDYDYILLPGIGNFGSAANSLYKNNWKEKIFEYLSNPRRRLMGICLGFQILFDSSEEALDAKGLGILRGKIKRLNHSKISRVPHVGWNSISPQRKGNFLNFINSPPDVYFVHSYGLLLNSFLQIDQFDEFTTTQHGSNKFISSFKSNNIYGCQFHPEKSSKIGNCVFESFFSIDA